jgi:hypothetical protein
MHTWCNSPTRQGSYTSKPSQQPTATAAISEEEGYISSRTTQSSFKNPSKISKPRKRLRKGHLKIIGPISSHTTLAAYQAAVSASPLLSLPCEIRNIIYAYALTSETQYLVYDKRHGRFKVSEIGAGLQQICHMVSRETMNMPLILNTLVFPPSTRSGEAEKKMVGCMGRIIRLAREFEWHDRLKIKVA